MRGFIGLLQVLLFLPIFSLAQVGIGTTSVDGSAKLQVDANNKGFLPPRVELTGTNVAGPITSPASGLLVYNTATAGVSPNNVTPGFYYWNGTTWNRLIIGSDNATNVTGTVTIANGGTGTTNGSITGSGALTFAAGGTNQNVIITPSGTGYTILNGKVGVGTSSPGAALHVESGTPRGALRLVDGTQGPGKVLTSDANGNAQWETGAFVLYTEVHSDDNSSVSYNTTVAEAKFTGFDNVVADNVVTTYGSNYGWDGSNERWIAPRTGKYRVTTNVYFNHNASFPNPRLYAYKCNSDGSNPTVCNITSATTGGNDLSTSTSAIISMTAGQYIEWWVPMAAGNYNYSATIWHGGYHTFMRIESVE
jgi:hypothetical protein